MDSWLALAAIIFVIIALLFFFRFLVLLFLVYIMRPKDRNRTYKGYRRGSAFSNALAFGFILGGAVAQLLLSVGLPGGLDATTFGWHMILLAFVSYLAAGLYKLADRVFLVHRADVWLLGRRKRIVPRLVHIVKAWFLTGTPPLLFFVGLGLLYILNALAWQPVLLLAVAVWSVGRGFAGSLMYRWALRTVPIEQTEWADLGPRIQQWTTLAGVRVDEILVLYLGEEDVATAAVVGLGRKTLLLGSALLRKADWRQIDAIVAHELGHIRKRHLPIYYALSLCQALLLASWPVFYDLRPLALWLWQQSTPTVVMLQQAQNAFVGAWYIMFFSALLQLLSMDIHHRAEFACDRYSVELAGDPMAMAFGLTTLVALNGTTMKMSGPTHPSAQRRMKRILTEPGRFAPWGKDPVPMFVGKEVIAKGGQHHRYIVPFDQATPRQPVPPQPWSRMPRPTPSAPTKEPVEQSASTATPQELAEQTEPIKEHPQAETQA
ncbi:MAG TPA: M48 family metalloprotease [Ktedonobacteraceae bacterium]|nr:M48 family metalloprotease [Ktedonobacteraceae bacterium]